MQSVIVKPTKSLSGTASAPPSKSYTHRAIILASLAKGKSIIQNPLISHDTLASVEACRKIGAKIDVLDRKLLVQGVSGNPQTPTGKIDVRNSGTTLRIMTSVASLCPGGVTLTGDSSIKKRPMRPLLDALTELHILTVSEGNNFPPVNVKGPLTGGTCKIRGDISSQFISGLLIATPLAKNDTEIHVTGELKSRPYLDLTLDAIEKFGGKIDVRDNNFYIKGNQNYTAITYNVEGDYSSAAFILAAAALTESEVTVKNLQGDSKQGDKKIIEILRDMGADLKQGEDEVVIKGTRKLSGIKVDLSQSPDLVPIVATLGSLALGETIIKNVEHLRYKESDRLKAMSTELKKMGADIEEGRDYLRIKGAKSGQLKGTTLHGWGDHRIVMALAVAGLRADGETIIGDAETIKISFPDFEDAMKKLGSDISIRDL